MGCHMGNIEIKAVERSIDFGQSAWVWAKGDMHLSGPLTYLEWQVSEQLEAWYVISYHRQCPQAPMAERQIELPPAHAEGAMLTSKRDRYRTGYSHCVAQAQAAAWNEFRQLWSCVADAYRVLLEFEDRYPTKHDGHDDSAETSDGPAVPQIDEFSA